MTAAGWRVAVGTALMLAALAAPPAAAQKGPKRKPAVHTVKIEGMKFTPAKLSIAAGDSVTWVNTDIVAHTATSGGFDSGTIPPDRKWTRTFAKGGAFDYVCDFHPTMKGTLSVK